MTASPGAKIAVNLYIIMVIKVITNQFYEADGKILATKPFHFHPITLLRDN